MSTTTIEKTAATDAALPRVLKEGYGDGAWHGPDMKAALADVTEEAAFRRPGKGRHSIAEIALHHAFCVRNVRAQVTGTPAEPFVLEGEDWFPVEKGGPVSWAQVTAALEGEQKKLARAVDAIASGKAKSPMSDEERFGIVLGVTCHAVYHAGQIQLVKKLIS